MVASALWILARSRIESTILPESARVDSSRMRSERTRRGLDFDECDVEMSKEPAGLALSQEEQEQLSTTAALDRESSSSFEGKRRKLNL